LAKALGWEVAEWRAAAAAAILPQEDAMRLEPLEAENLS
jgi:hypothetical protein